MASPDDLEQFVRELVARAQAGDGDAEDALYAWLQPRFLVIASSFLDNWHDAEDAVQLAFLALARVLQRLDLSRNPKAYCFEICRNASRNVNRRLHRQRNRVFAEGGRELHLEVEQIASETPAASETTEQSEHANWVWDRVMQLLNQRDQTILRMRFQEDRTWAEIAQHLQMRSVGGTFARFKRLCDRVRREIPCDE